MGAKTKLHCAVIGAGAVGSGAALALAKAGVRVRLFERFPFGHDKGSSHGPTRLLRLAYFEHPDYVPLMRRALALWRGLEAESGERLFERTGVIEAGPPGGFLVGGVRRAAAIHGLAIENFTPAAFGARFPWLHLGAGDEAVFEAEAGFVYADKTVRAQIALAHRNGAALHPGEAVRGWTAKADRLVLHAAGDYAVDRVIVAAGTWATDLLGAEIAPVTAAEKALFWTAAGDQRFTAANGFLPFAVETRSARMFYGFPAIDGDGVKIAEHTGARMLGRPEDRTGRATVEERAGVEEFLRDYAPGIPLKLGREETCLYELSPDQHFIIGRHPRDPRVAFAAGLSGHGFKFAPLIGEALADLALDGELAPEFSFLDPARLGKS